MASFEQNIAFDRPPLPKEEVNPVSGVIEKREVPPDAAVRIRTWMSLRDVRSPQTQVNLEAAVGSVYDSMFGFPNPEEKTDLKVLRARIVSNASRSLNASLSEPLDRDEDRQRVQIQHIFEEMESHISQALTRMDKSMQKTISAPKRERMSDLPSVFTSNSEEAKGSEDFDLAA